MSFRGGATLKVYRGLAKVSAQPQVDGYTEFIEEYAGMEDAGQIDLSEVNWFDAVGLAVAVPNAVWELFIGPDCEDANTYCGYHPDAMQPSTPLIAAQLSHEIVVPLFYTATHLDSRKAWTLANLRRLDQLLQDLAGPSMNRSSQFELG